MDFLKRSPRHSKLERISNEIITQKMDVQNSILDFVKHKWFGHVKRMPLQIIPKRVLKWIPAWRRKRGRLRKMWISVIF